MESRIWLRSRSESFSRRWFNPHLRRLYPFRRRSPESSAQEKGQELSDGVFNSTPPQEAQVSNTPATLQDGHHRSSAQEKGQELSDGVFNSTPPQEAQVSNTPATLQDGHHRMFPKITGGFRQMKRVSCAPDTEQKDGRCRQEGTPGTGSHTLGACD
ncbi:uncharacterized protein WM277_015426 [Molossus nigricans]